MQINLMPVIELRVDIDEFVWVWNAIEKSWARTTTWTANALHKTYPERYTHWVNDESIENP